MHFVNEIPDGGEIIAQKSVDILPGDTPERLQRRVMEQAEWILLPRAAEQVCAGVSHRRGKYRKKQPGQAERQLAQRDGEASQPADK